MKYIDLEHLTSEVKKRVVSPLVFIRLSFNISKNGEISFLLEFNSNNELRFIERNYQPYTLMRKKLNWELEIINGFEKSLHDYIRGVK